ncbi:MAG: hypothetical protein IT332_14480 [Ardenticatenales bacterium]|nr:hypothetical protein [Ardenticatenales bacterium]
MTPTTRAVLSRDTAPWAEAMLVAHWRRLSPAARFDQLVLDVRAGRFLMRAGARMRLPDASDLALNRAVAQAWLGHGCTWTLVSIAKDFEAIQMTDPDPYAIAARVSETLDGLGVPHVVVGSLASIAFGEPRMTRDGDLVADLKSDQVAAFVSDLASDFFVDDMAIREAVRAQSHFNILHRATMFKIDVFLSARSPFGRAGIQRAVRIERGGHSLPVATAEDSLLAKLRWYRQGNEVSDQQWRDILGILLVQGDALDSTYLDRWAVELGVADLLQRARDTVAGS